MINDVIEKIEEVKIIPVIKIGDAKSALPLAHALISGGIPIAEITFRSNAAEETIRQMATLDDFLVGAGTVLNVETVKKAAGAGAKFIVSPGLNEKVVRYCLENNLPIVPGVMTPTEIGVAIGFGLDVLKFFPAEAAGGVKTLKAVGAPFGNARFIPTGGINTKNIGDYLGLKNVMALGGSWMAKPKDIDSGNFGEIERLTKEAVKIVRELS